MKIIVVLMAVVFMAGMAIWLFLFKNCYEMIQDIRSGTRKVPVIRKAVDKYDDCCKLEIAVNNTEVFVEKIIENEKICGLRMKAWQRIAGMVKYGIALLGIFSAVLFKGNTDEVYICAAVAAMCCVSLHFMDCMADVDGYLKDTVVELVDYLENSGAVRSEAGKVMAAKLKGKAASEFMKMNRRYDYATYKKICDNLRKRIPDVTITSDFIAGFPGETEEQFQNTLKAMSELELDYSNTAAYSPREKTVAAKWVDLYIPEDVKTERLARLNEHNRLCCLKSNQKYVGREMEVLIEKKEIRNGKGVITGRTRNNKIVHIPYEKDLTGEFVNVKITRARTWYLNGEMIG